MGVLNHLQKILPNLHRYTDQFRPSENKLKFIWDPEQQSAFGDTLRLISGTTKVPL